MKINKLEYCLNCSTKVNKQHIHISNLGLPGIHGSDNIVKKYICCDDPKIVDIVQDNNNLALIDSDSIVYTFAYRYRDYYEKNLNVEDLRPTESVLAALKKDLLSYIYYIVSTTNSRYYIGLLASRKRDKTEEEEEQENCFRYGLCKTFEYKSKRKTKDYVKFWRPYIYSILIDDLNFQEVVRTIEVDDMLAILHKELKDSYNVIVAGQDKDLLQIPTSHFNYVTGKFTDATSETDIFVEKSKLRGYGYKLLYGQCIAGDGGDDIPGIKGLGPVAAVKALKDCKSEFSCIREVIKLYVNNGKTKEQLLDNYRAVKLLESSDAKYISEASKTIIDNNKEYIVGNIVDLFDQIKNKLK